MAVIEDRIQQLLEDGIDVSYFDDCDRDALSAYMGNLKAHRCRLDAVESNVILALSRVDKKARPSARPSDNADELAKETGTSKAEANRKTRRAELFDRLPQVTAALAAGDITSGHADLLTHVPNKYQDALARDLEELLATAAQETVDEFKETIRAWKDQTAKDAGEDPHKQRYEARSYTKRRQTDGMVRFGILLHPEGAAKVDGSVTRKAQELLREDQANGTVDQRTHQQRCADALIALCENNNSRDGDKNGDGEKPRGSSEPLIIVGIPLADLQAGLDGHAYGGGPVSAETVRKLACEGSVIPMVFNSDGVVLDMGRKTRFATANQRLALKARYENCCAVPGCDRPFEWCHIHHIDHWEHGGATDLDNLIPVCSRHHTLIHDGQLQIERINGIDHWNRKPEKPEKFDHRSRTPDRPRPDLREQLHNTVREKRRARSRPNRRTRDAARGR